MTTRRVFLSRAALAAGGMGAATVRAQVNDIQSHTEVTSEAVKKMSPPNKPVIVTRHTGDNTIDEAYRMLQEASDTLDAAHHICLGRENDPSDHSVGLGGLPNEEGVVELDSCCMHGPARTAGSVGGVRNIKNVCLVARKVMEHTGHVMLAGDGAERFAVDEGFPRENLLTDDARKIWMLWKENNSTEDWWGPGLSSPEWKDPLPGNTTPKSSANLQRAIPRNPGPADVEAIHARSRRLMTMAADLGIAPEKRWEAVEQVLWPTTGTIHVSTLNAKGEMSGATTTSGLAWKLPGRLGDSPIIGAGCYTDQDVGSAGATGSGEENIKVAGAHSIVDLMRQGLSPQQAGLATLRRIARNYEDDPRRLRYVDMIYYILRKDGAYAGCSLWSTGPTGKPKTFAVHDGAKRIEKCVYLFKGTAIDWPPY
ncbi:MAG: N(4)-(beta-N-acetylglucosaminyl)-L-asparaginase [Acidobacteriaceae bacterium]